MPLFKEFSFRISIVWMTVIGLVFGPGCKGRQTSQTNAVSAVDQQNFDNAQNQFLNKLTTEQQQSILNMESILTNYESSGRIVYKDASGKLVDKTWARLNLSQAYIVLVDNNDNELIAFQTLADLALDTSDPNQQNAMLNITLLSFPPNNFSNPTVTRQGSFSTANDAASEQEKLTLFLQGFNTDLGNQLSENSVKGFDLFELLIPSAYASKGTVVAEWLGCTFGLVIAYAIFTIAVIKFASVNFITTFIAFMVLVPLAPSVLGVGVSFCAGFATRDPSQSN